MRSFTSLARLFLLPVCCGMLTSIVSLETPVSGFTYYATAASGSPYCWNEAALPNGVIYWQAAPDAPAIVRDSVNNAAQAWSAAVHGVLQFSEGTGGINIIWDTDGSLIPDSLYLACTNLYVNVPGTITGGRIIINAHDYTWKRSGDGAVGPNVHGVCEADLDSVILHEMGHALGLGHSDNDPSKIVGPWGYGNMPTMNSVILPGAQNLHADDRAGICFIYTGAVPPAAPPSPLLVTATPLSGRAPIKVLFREADGDPGTIWDFGDGKAAAGAKAAHRFTAPGVYTVTAQSCGKSGSVIIQVVKKQKKLKKIAGKTQPHFLSKPL